MESLRDIQNYFDTVAPQWDQMRAGYFGDEIRRAALAQGRPQAHHTAADLGCGTGYILEALAPLVSRAYGIDASPGMLQKVREKMQSAGYRHVNLIEGRLDALPLAENSLDLAFSNMVLHHLPQPAAALNEAFRVLRPGGRYIVTDLDEHKFSWMKEEMQDLWLGFPRALIQEWFAQAGFINLGIDCVPGCCCAASANDEQAQVGTFVAWGVKPE